MKILQKFKLLIPTVFTLAIIAIFYFTKIVMFKLYPPIVNFCIFMIFFVSLFNKETVIQKIARTMEGGELIEPIKKYTRNLTYIWSIFLFINFLISTITVFLTDNIWMIYNGCISYFLLGAFFIIEYIVRINFKRKNMLNVE